jgi:phosphoribosylanthranilate isomerase
MELKIKVCGLKNAENLKQIDALGVDYVGMIFYSKSPRFMQENPDLLKDVIATKVGVFVNASLEEIQEKQKVYGIKVAQLHGAESPEFCAQVKALGLQVWKAFGVDNSFDFTILNQYSSVNLFLFDTKTPMHGGSGIKFNWELLKRLPQNKHFMLSGGIDLSDAASIRQLDLKAMLGVDINSKFEIEAGVKDVKKVAEFIQQLKG